MVDIFISMSCFGCLFLSYACPTKVVIAVIQLYNLIAGKNPPIMANEVNLDQEECKHDHTFGLN